LVYPFQNIKIGCVSGQLIYNNPNNINSGIGESFYLKYENYLKKLESKLGYVAGANGAIYAIRRELFYNLPKNAVNDDFIISMRVILKGFKNIFVPDAVAYENVAPSMKMEFKRHIRDATGHYTAIFHLARLLNPFIGLPFVIYFSHRILRWLCPFFMIFVFIYNFLIFDENKLINLFFYLQIIFYIFSIFGFYFSLFARSIPLIFFLPYYFCNLNLALFLGFLNSITSVQNGKWEKTR